MLINTYQEQIELETRNMLGLVGYFLLDSEPAVLTMGPSATNFSPHHHANPVKSN